MGTVAGVNTRRYHGLLIATLKPPADRYSILSRVEEIVETGDATYALAAVQYPGVVSPAGYTLIQSFSSLPHPTWIYRAGPVTVQKSLRLLDGEQSVMVTYRTNVKCKFRIRFFLSLRDYHSLASENSNWNRDFVEQAGSIQFHPYGDLPPLIIYHNAGTFKADGIWFFNHEYLLELERGLDYREDLYSPGVLEYSFVPEEEVYLLATLESEPNRLQTDKPIADPLAWALDQFRVTRADNKPTLMAGYPWFTDWSRDTLISLPAFIAAGFDPTETKSILNFLLAERKQGILPNRFSDKGSAPEYNTVDASLWFFIAADSYIQTTGDIEFVRNTLFPAAIDIIDWHLKGTFYGIHVDMSDHLLSGGEPGTQLTWMDAKIGEYVVTPRMGKPVEINALWFNALKIAGNWAEISGDISASQKLSNEAAAVAESFRNKFWNTSRGCLHDVLTPSGPDASLRPNQLFAISLPYPLLNREKARSIVQVVQETLLTPVGLRTLEPADPQYRPRFDGDMFSRDSAYHQGTVWPWLIGPFIHAYLYAHDESTDAKAFCKGLTDSTLDAMNHYCVGTLREVSDGDTPHHPGGCPAQLWSVAQLILSLQRLAR